MLQALDELLGVEGTAAAMYFEHVRRHDQGGRRGRERPGFDFKQRNRRPPRDPVNALLSLAYALLARDLTMTCHAVGFDPFMGYYHQLRFGRPALALDLMEGFRPLVADSAVITAINTRMCRPRDFVHAGGVGRPDAERAQRLHQRVRAADGPLVTHPVFGYRISYRRVLEVQTRLLARYVTGEIPGYPGFEHADALPVL